jgi:hypothetical protein
LISRKIKKYTWLTRDVFEFKDQTVDDVCENQIPLNVSSQQNSTQLGEKVEAAIKVKSNLARRIQVENVVVGFSRKVLNKNKFESLKGKAHIWFLNKFPGIQIFSRNIVVN